MTSHPDFSRPDFSRIWAIVPLRGLETAKTRLRAALSGEERLELVISMVIRTLTATRDARSLAGTVLVTADRAAADLAAMFGAQTLVQRLPGLNAALREARSLAMGLGASATVVVPIDLPAVNAEALDRLIDEVREAAGSGLDGAAPSGAAESGSDGAAPIVAAVPDRHGLGTNVLFTAPPAVIEPAFGEASLAAHRAAALAAGARFLELGGPLTLDVDTGADLLVADSAGRPVVSVPARGGGPGAS